MSVTVSFTDAESEDLRRRAESEHTTIEDVVRRAVQLHLTNVGRDGAPSATGGLLAEIDTVRSDERLLAVVDGVIERDREILDRLAE